MGDWVEQLEKLAALKEAGVLTEDEFAHEKSKILASRETLEKREPASDAGIWGWVRRNRPIVLGAGAALLVGSALAFSVRSDILGALQQRRPSSEKSSARPSAPTPALRLQDLLVFASASNCAPGQELERLHASLMSSSPLAAREVDSIRTVPRLERLQPLPDGPGVTIAHLPLDGEWQGLHVTALRFARWEGLPVTSFQIRFREDAEAVEPTLGRIGFSLGKRDKLKLVVGSNGKIGAIGLEALPSGSALTCAQGVAEAGGSEEPTAPSDKEG